MHNNYKRKQFVLKHKIVFAIAFLSVLLSGALFYTEYKKERIFVSAERRRISTNIEKAEKMVEKIKTGGGNIDSKGLIGEIYLLAETKRFTEANYKLSELVSVIHKEKLRLIAAKEEERVLEEDKQKAAEAEKKKQEELAKKKISVLGAQINVQTVTFGYSGQGRAITGSIFGKGAETILLFGAIHGNEKGTATLLNTLVQEIAKNPSLVGPNKKIIIIPLLNPDGYYLGLNKVNANNVNLNLNFATTDWKQYGGDSNLFAGNEPFTESESRVLRDVVANYDVKKMISFHAQGNLVNPEYGHGPSEEFARWYAGRSGYGYFNDLSWYYHGTATRWFVEKYGRPAITVELPCYNCSDWSKNKGVLFELIR